MFCIFVVLSGEYLDTSNTAAITRQQDHMVWAAQAQKKE